MGSSLNLTQNIRKQMKYDMDVGMLRGGECFVCCRLIVLSITYIH